MACLTRLSQYQSLSSFAIIRQSPARLLRCETTYFVNSRCLTCGYVRRRELALQKPFLQKTCLRSSNWSRWQQTYRGAKSQAPREDPDVERLHRSMRAMERLQPIKHDGDRLIYEVRSANYLHFVTGAFYLTALSGLYMAPDFLIGAWERDSLDLDTFFTLMMLASGIVVLPVCLRVFALRLIFKLYHNEARNTYLAVVSKTLFGVTKKRFSGSEVVVTKENSFERTFQLTSFRVKGRPYFVNASNFKLPSDYNKLMGYY